MVVLASFTVIDAITVANVRAIGRAKPPNGMLDEPREDLRIAGVKSASVDLAGGSPNDIGTAAFGITADAIAVRYSAVLQNAGSMQKVMDQRIDRDHRLAGFEPVWSIF